MKDAKTLLLEFLAAVTRGQNAAALFAEDGAVERKRSIFGVYQLTL